MVDKLYHRANLHSSFRPIVHFVCDCATPPVIEKLTSKGIAMYVYDISTYYAWTGN